MSDMTPIERLRHRLEGADMAADRLSEGDARRSYALGYMRGLMEAIKILEEAATPKNVECPNCDGRGWWWCDIGDDEMIRQRCPNHCTPENVEGPRCGHHGTPLRPPNARHIPQHLDHIEAACVHCFPELFAPENVEEPRWTCSCGATFTHGLGAHLCPDNGGREVRRMKPIEVEFGPENVKEPK